MCGCCRRAVVRISERKRSLPSAAELRVQDLDGDVALMLQVDRAIHGCHSACPQLALDVVAVGKGSGEAREDISHRHAPGIE